MLEGIKFDKKRKSGTPMILSPVKARITLGDAKAELNAMTGTWFVSGQKGEKTPYLCDTVRRATQLLQTIDHYNRTSERKTFKAMKVHWTKQIEE